jgi:hypothetical protein
MIVQLVGKKNGNCQNKIDTFLQFFQCETFLREIGYNYGQNSIILYVLSSGQLIDK